MVLRLAYFTLVLVPFTLVCLPIQLLLLKASSRCAKVIPRAFFRLLAFGLGLKIRVLGTPVTQGPVLLLTNHISWLDIVAIGAVMPVRFVAKSDVARYPLVGFFANLSRTIFVERERRTEAGRTAKDIGAALKAGDAVLLFPEGTTDIGTHVLPFKSALIGAVDDPAGLAPVPIQPITIAYTAIANLPLSRHERSSIAWVGDMGVGDNLAAILRSGPKSVSIAFGTPVDTSGGRKAVAQRAEAAVRQMLVTLNRS